MPERHRFIRGMVSWIGFRQEPILYDRDARFCRPDQKYPFRKLVALAIDGIFVVSTCKPLRFALRCRRRVAAISVKRSGVWDLRGHFLAVVRLSRTPQGWSQLDGGRGGVHSAAHNWWCWVFWANTSAASTNKTLRAGRCSWWIPWFVPGMNRPRLAKIRPAFHRGGIRFSGRMHNPAGVWHAKCYHFSVYVVMVKKRTKLNVQWVAAGCEKRYENQPRTALSAA